MGYKDSSCIHNEVYVGYNANSHLFKVYVSIIYSESRTYASFLKETCIYIKRSHFKGISRNFQTLVSSRNF